MQIRSKALSTSSCVPAPHGQGSGDPLVPQPFYNCFPGCSCLDHCRGSYSITASHPSLLEKNSMVRPNLLLPYSPLPFSQSAGLELCSATHAFLQHCCYRQELKASFGGSPFVPELIVFPAWLTRRCPQGADC